MKFKTISREIEARQFTTHNQNEIEEWSGGSLRGIKLPPQDRELSLWAFDMEHRAVVGDWIIKDDEGNCYPMGDNKFCKTYAPLTAVQHD